MARQLITMGFDAVALAGGYTAWRVTQPVEPKHSRPVNAEPTEVQPRCVINL